MRTRWLAGGVFVINILLLVFYVHKQLQLAEIIRNAGLSLTALQQRNSQLSLSLSQLPGRLKEVRSSVNHRFSKVKDLVEKSRRNFIRIKGVHEKAEENLEEKVVEIGRFLDVSINENDVERVNRIGVKKSNRPRPIVAQLSNYKLKQQLIRRAAKLSGNIEFSIQDDVTSYVIPGLVISQKDQEDANGCGRIKSIGKPMLRSKVPVIFGAWSRDSCVTDERKKQIWVLPHFHENRVVEEYGTMRDLTRQRPRVTYTLPYEWAGTGHVICNGSLYFNKHNSSILAKYNFRVMAVEVEKPLPEAAFGNMAPYQWSGTTDVDFAVDEMGLWVIYATSENALDIVVSKLDPLTLEVIESWKTNWRKQWCGNAFMACGVLYVLKKYDQSDTSLSYMYDTKTKVYKHIQIPFRNAYEWNTMLSYNHKEKLLYAWDRGYLVNYNVTFDETS